MSDLTTEEILQRLKAATQEKKEKLVEEKSQDRKFWEALTKETDLKLYEKALEEGIIPPQEVYSMSSLLEIKFPPQVWLVEGLLPAEGFTALTGVPASYKSFLTEHLAICIAQNQPFLGHFPVTQGAVLLIDKENPLSLLQERFLALGATKEAPIWVLQDPDHFKLQDEATLTWTINFIKENQISLVIIDSFIHILKGDENNSQDIAATFEKLKLLPCAVCFIHHHRKTIRFFTGTPLETIRGSSDIAAEVESHLAVDQIPTGLRIAQYKNRRGKLNNPFLVIPQITEDTIKFEYKGELEEETLKKDRARYLIIDHLSTVGETARKTLLEVLSEQVGRDSIDKAIKQMEKEGELLIRYEGRAKYLSLSPHVSPGPGNEEISLLEQSYLEETD